MSRSRVLAVLGWGGFAAVVVGVALTVFAPYLAGVESGDPGPPEGTIQLTKQEQRIVVPAHKTYGIWAEDTDNNGYGIGACTVVDDRGKPVRTQEPNGYYTEGSESEWGDFAYEFQTGSGKLTLLDCKGDGAEFSVRPLMRADGGGPFDGPGPFGGLMWLVVPMIIGTQLIQLGVGMLIAWLVVRLVWKPTPPTAAFLP